MAEAQVQNIFIDAMSKIGALTLDETPSASELNKCMRNANNMLDTWSTKKLMVRGFVTENFPLVSTQGSYTIGPSANFNTAKPIKLEDAWVRDSSNTDYGVGIVTQEEWDSYPDKAIIQARPEYLFYDPGLAQQTGTNTGTINLYPAPDTGPYTLFLVSYKYITEFVNLTDPVTFEPMYSEALVYNLAVRIFPDFYNGKDPSKLLIAMAKSTMKDIERVNTRWRVGVVDLPGSKPGFYDVYSDSWR